VLSAYNRADAEKLFPKCIRVVNNGIPDPCPGFEKDVLPRRTARLVARRKLASGDQLAPSETAAAGNDANVFKVLYLAHCTRDKGLFDSIDGVILANERLTAMNSPLTIQLHVAGSFFNKEEEIEFEKACSTPGGKRGVKYLGFVSGSQKEAALRDSDFFCFPTFFRNENQPVNLIEAMAYGLPILTSRWRSIPELFPPDHGMLVDVQSPAQIADALVAALTGPTAESFREIFMKQFNLDQYLAALAGAFKSLEPDNSDAHAVSPGTHPVPVQNQKNTTIQSA
jgi:glycosyltransferase involved in cell wall biosynthesis